MISKLSSGSNLIDNEIVIRGILSKILYMIFYGSNRFHCRGYTFIGFKAILENVSSLAIEKNKKKWIGERYKNTCKIPYE